MTIKEHSLIKAVSNVGALPAVLTANEYVAGAVAATACGFFGGLVMLFQASIVGGGAETLFVPVRGGAIAGHGFAAIAMAGAWLVYAFDEEEAERRNYAISGLLTAALWIWLWLVFSAPIYDWLVELGPLTGARAGR